MKAISAADGEAWMRAHPNAILVDLADTTPCAWRFNGEDFQFHLSGSEGYGEPGTDGAGWHCHPPPGEYNGIQFYVGPDFKVSR